MTNPFDQARATQSMPGEGRAKVLHSIVQQKGKRLA